MIKKSQEDRPSLCYRERQKNLVERDLPNLLWSKGNCLSYRATRLPCLVGDVGGLHDEQPPLSQSARGGASPILAATLCAGHSHSLAPQQAAWSGHSIHKDQLLAPTEEPAFCCFFLFRLDRQCLISWFLQSLQNCELSQSRAINYTKLTMG